MNPNMNYMITLSQVCIFCRVTSVFGQLTNIEGTFISQGLRFFCQKKKRVEDILKSLIRNEYIDVDKKVK